MFQVFHMREGPEKLLTPHLIAKVLLYRATSMFRKPSAQAAKVSFLQDLCSLAFSLPCCMHPSVVA